MAGPFTWIFLPRHVFRARAGWPRCGVCERELGAGSEENAGKVSLETLSAGAVSGIGADCTTQPDPEGRGRNAPRVFLSVASSGFFKNTSRG